MKLLVEFVVWGKPEPRGSKTAAARKGGGLYYRDANAESYTWMATVEEFARIAMLDAELTPTLDAVTDPIRLDVVFYVERPAGHYTTKGVLSAAGRRKLYPKSKPDRGKYLRAIEDAMTKLVYVDDAQIVSGTVDKRYGAPARAVVKVFTLHEDDAVQDEADELARDAA